MRARFAMITMAALLAALAPAAWAQSDGPKPNDAGKPEGKRETFKRTRAAGAPRETRLPGGGEIWETPPALKDAEARVYKTVGGTELKLYFIYPKDHKPTDKTPAIVFFFGGGWTAGSPAQFEPQARHFAARGMVTACAEYRIKSRHGVAPEACVADAKSAIRWMRGHAAELGIDPARIVASGGSAGGHIAACAGVIQGFDEMSEGAKFGSVPDAMILFNPALDVTPYAVKSGFGKSADALSPALHVGKGAPPAIVFHGKDDSLVPFEQAERFAAAMKAAGSRCEVMGFPGEGHGFFNYKGSGAAPPEHPYTKTLKAADDFLVSLGYLAKSE